MKYLEALPTLAQGKNSTIFLPAEAAGVMGAIGGLRELVSRAGNPGERAETPKAASPDDQRKLSGS